MCKALEFMAEDILQLGRDAFDKFNVRLDERLTGLFAVIALYNDYGVGWHKDDDYSASQPEIVALNMKGEADFNIETPTL